MPRKVPCLNCKDELWVIQSQDSQVCNVLS